jgi:hypothetical protein
MYGGVFGHFEMEKLLEEVYGDPRKAGSFGGPQKLRREVNKLKKFHVTVKAVKDWLKGKDTYTKHRAARTNFERNQVISPYIDAQWQGDLAEVGNLSQKNDGVRYLLILIDIVSKYVWVEPLKTKSGPSVLDGLKRIFERTERRPEKLQTDDGKEFVNKGMQQYLRQNKIEFFTLKSDKKAAVAERMVRTLKEKIWRYMHEKHTKRYLDVLQDLVESYNQTFHESIKRSPVEVSWKNEGEVLRTLYGQEWSRVGNEPRKGGAVVKHKPGDFVRISRVKGPFKKGYTGHWTEEIFVVDGVIESRPHILYKLKDLNQEAVDGSFYQHEIQGVDKDLRGFWKVEEVLQTRLVRGNKKEYLVKWEGYPESMNSWVKEKDIKKIGE